MIRFMLRKPLHFLYVPWLCLLLILAGCSTLPDLGAQSARYAEQSARISGARGVLSQRKSDAIVAELKRRSGDLDILDRQIAFEQAIVGSPLVVGNDVVLLENGEATYAAMFAAINAATDHINIESYIFEDDEVGQQFADALIAKQLQGVQVNLLYDSVGAWGTPPEFFDRLRQAGIAVLEFNPVNPLVAKKAWEINHRDHRKLLVVDGQVAFLGGINISNVYSSGSSPSASHGSHNTEAGWRDTDVQIKGPAVAEFQRLFIETWQKQRGHPLAEKTYFPPLTVQGREIVRAIGSTPDDPYSLIYLTLMSAIANAQKQILITNAYFVPDPQLVEELLAAAARGVDVQLILPGNSDSALVLQAGRSHYATLLAGGVKIYERQAAVLHAKTALVDGVWACVGSSNLDWRSALDNDEINAVILGRAYGQQMQAAFARDVAASTAITLESWSDRSLLQRIKELGASLWERLL